MYSAYLRYISCFHSTKEVSKAPKVCSSLVRATRVSIPLRKFPRNAVPRGMGRTARVSIPLRKFPRETGLSQGLLSRFCFHSTKEVSKGGRPCGTTSPGIGFHSTKEVSKGGHREGRGKISAVSIPLRKFPRYGHVLLQCGFYLVSIPLRKFPRSAVRRRGLSPGRSFHSTKEVSKGA